MRVRQGGGERLGGGEDQGEEANHCKEEERTR